jgi:hypothetical protein
MRQFGTRIGTVRAVPPHWDRLPETAPSQNRISAWTCDWIASSVKVYSVPFGPANP